MKKSYALALAIAALTGTVRAQEAADSASEPVAAQSQSEQIDALKGKIDGVEESYLDTKSTVDKLAKIKVSGYIQARYEYAMDTGIMGSNAAGSNMTSSQMQGRFKVRRGRVKVGQEGDLGDFAVQVVTWATGAASPRQMQVAMFHLTRARDWVGRSRARCPQIRNTSRCETRCTVLVQAHRCAWGSSSRSAVVGCARRRGTWGAARRDSP